MILFFYYIMFYKNEYMYIKCWPGFIMVIIVENRLNNPSSNLGKANALGTSLNPPLLPPSMVK